MIPTTTLPDGTILLGTPLRDAADPDAPIGGIPPTRIGTPLRDAAAGTEREPSLDEQTRSIALRGLIAAGA